MRRGGSVGLVVLLAALVVVLLLVARSWRSLAPEALQVGPDTSVRAGDRGESGAGEALGRGDLPDLQTARERSDEHARQVGEALAGTNQ